MRLSIFMLAALLPLVVAAKPPELAQAINAGKPVGSAQMRALWTEVYRASFWSDSGSWKRPPYALSLTYGMSFTAEELAKRTAQEMAHVSSMPEASRAAYAAELKALWPDVKTGDRLTALAEKDRTLFFHNGRRLGSIGGNEFMQAFFGIWLSPDSSEPDMQRQLLAQ